MTATLYSPINGCRLCGNAGVALMLDLGEQALTGIFPKSRHQRVPQGPLQLGKCEACDLVQLLHNYDLRQLYGESYGYRSGLNQSMVRHLHAKVERIRERVALRPGDLVVDIGANDSTLLQAYGKEEFELVGIDPSGRKFARYYPPHVSLIPEFFSAQQLERRYRGGRAKVVTSIAMFYDLEEPMNFVREVADVLADDGIWVFEQSYLPFMLDTTSYDTVCHEHLEYYALKQVKRMTDAARLKIVDIEFNDVNGGSFALTVAKDRSSYPEASDSIERAMSDEARRGLAAASTYAAFAQRTAEHRVALFSVLQKLKRQGKTVLGYGASTKGNVMIQYCGIDADLIRCIAEVNEDKFGAFTPGSTIPIVSEQDARALRPDYFLVFPWHFKTGILQREQAFISAGGRLIFPLPSLEIISASGSETIWRA